MGAVLAVITAGIVAITEVVNAITNLIRELKETPRQPVPVSQAFQTRTRKSEAQIRDEAMLAFNEEQQKRPKSAEELRKEREAKIDSGRKKEGIDCVKDYNFGFCGASGTGKSSLINAVLGIPDSADGAAKVGETETTSVICPYQSSNPEESHIKYWDIPGCGTQRHPGATYFEDKKLYIFDMLIIISAGRFSEFDIGIAVAAAAYETPVVFVRSKSDLDIDNRSFDDERPKAEVKLQLRLFMANPLKLRKDIQADIRKQLQNEKQLSDRPIYVVNKWVFHGADNAGKRSAEEYGLDELALVEHVVGVALSRRGVHIP